MRKRISILILTLLLVLSFTAQAISTRSSVVRLDLSFKGTTATCYVPVIAEKSDDEIEIIVKLWQGEKCIKTWRDNGIGILLFEKTASVVKGKTYELSADVTINGKSYPCETVAGTCK